MPPSLLTLQGSVLKPRKWMAKISLALLFSAVLCAGVFAAMDAVIPGMEKASEARKKAVREQWARDSVRQQEEVGRQRFEKRMQYKNSLIEGMRMEAAARNAMIAREIESDRLATQESRNNTSQALYFIACIGILLGGTFLLRHQITSLDCWIPLEEWLPSTRPEPENPANRGARLKRMAPVRLSAPPPVQSTQRAIQESPSNAPVSPTQTDHPGPEESLHPHLRSTPGKADESSIHILSQTGPVDMETLLACANGDVQNMSEMALLYLEQTCARIDKIKAALTEGSRSKAIGLVKMSASASEFCGMKSIRTTFEKLQLSIQTSAIPDALAMVDPVSTECDRVRSYLQTHLPIKGKIESTH
jgi:TolA-binding protein